MSHVIAAFLALAALFAAIAIPLAFVSQPFAAQLAVHAVSEARVVVGRTAFAVEVAATPAAQMRGLSGRESLPGGHGLLFPFDPPKVPGFWMKDMKFPIDIIWISGGRVIGIAANAPPDDRPNRTVYIPPQDVDAVLEVPAGSAARFAIRSGSAVSVE